MSSTYSQEATIAAISAFYEVVKEAHGNDVANLKHAPPEGWSEITHDLFQPMGKSHAAIELLRHLPYFANDETFCIMPHTNATDYTEYNFLCAMRDARERSDSTQAGGNDAEADDEEPGRQPPHIVQIATGRPRNGYDIYVDVNRGAVIWHAMDGSNVGDSYEPGDLEPLDDPADDEAGQEYRDAGEEDPTEWRRAPTFRIDTFFKMCTDKLRRGEWVAEKEELGRGSVREK